MAFLIGRYRSPPSGLGENQRDSIVQTIKTSHPALNNAAQLGTTH